LRKYTDEEFLMIKPDNTMFFKLYREVTKDTPVQSKAKADELRARALVIMKKLGAVGYAEPLFVVNRGQNQEVILGLEVAAVLEDVGEDS
jgi:hypothetical protein